MGETTQPQGQPDEAPDLNALIADARRDLDIRKLVLEFHSQSVVATAWVSRAKGDFAVREDAPEAVAAALAKLRTYVTGSAS